MAIDQALFKGYQRNGDGYVVRVQFRDTTKTPQTWQEWMQVQGDTLAAVTADASRQIAERIKADTRQDVLAGIAVDAPIPLAPAATPAADIADATWLNNVRLFQRAQDLKDAWVSAGTAIPSQFTTDFGNLGTTVATGYTTARGGKL